MTDPNDTAERYHVGRARLLAKGYRPDEIRWWPPTEPKPSSSDPRMIVSKPGGLFGPAYTFESRPMTDSERKRWLARRQKLDEKQRLGHWTVSMDDMKRVDRERMYRIGFVCGVCADIAGWLHGHRMRPLARPFYWVVNICEGKS